MRHLKISILLVALLLVGCNDKKEQQRETSTKQDYKDLLMICKDEPTSCSFYNVKTKKLISNLEEYDSAENFNEDSLALVSKNGKFGYIDSDAKVVIPLKYDSLGTFTHNGLAYFKLDNKYGYINKKAKTVIDNIFDKAYDFNDKNIAKVLINGKYGFIDINGNFTIQAEFDSVGEFTSNNLTWVEKNDKYGYVNTSGKEIIPLKYDGSCNFSQGLACIEVGSKWGFVDEKGDVVIPAKYDFVENFSQNSLSVVRLKYKYGFIDKKGEIKIPIKYNDAFSFDYNPWIKKSVAEVSVNGDYYYIDENQSRVDLDRYLNIADTAPAGSVLFPIHKDEKWGFVDEQLNLVIPYKYDSADFFYNGYAKVQDGELGGYIDTKGEYVVTFTTKDDGSFVINKK